MESRYLSCETIEGGFCGSCASCKIKTKRHPDIRLVEPEKTTISIDQVRDMINEIAYQPLEARYRVVILDPAEQMRLEAHNSLLKTLEEPPSRTIIILIATNPYMLLDTIRSRSRLLHFGEISQESIERQLVVQQGRKKEEARLAAALSGGSLAAALSFNVDEYRETRALALEFVSLVLRNGSFVEASAIAMQVAKDKEFFGEWIESASALLRDVYYCKFDAEKIGQRDLQARIVELAQKSSRSSLVKVINAIDKLKADLQFSVNRQIALEAAFLGLAGRDNRRSAEDRTPRH
jgi:DNA polymerase-3 subunit delta'